jgi:quinol-cytochrome oxidoreductase complex cytochrome b subunit
MRGQLPTWLIVKALNDATPAASATLVTPPSVHELVIAIVSAEPVPVVTVLPYWSSVDTLNNVSATLSDAVAGGAVVKASLVAAVGVTVIAVLFMVPLSPADVSVAVSVHDVPVLIATLVNAAVPAVAASVSVDPPLNVQDDEITIVSVGEPPAVMLTLKLVRVAPATTVP